MRIQPSRAPLAEINVTPFVDVVLVLLIIFMVTAPFLQGGLEIDLPKVASRGLDVREGLIVSVRADRTVELHHGRLGAVRHSTVERDERCDHFLEEMWYLWEDGKEAVLGAIRSQKVADRPGTAYEVVERGYVARDGERLEFTPEGRGRALNLVRRHRLAECLFATTMHMTDPNLDATACRMEHILDPEVTEGICGFLKHPTACPHGKPVPAGECFPPEYARSGPPVVTPTETHR